MYAVCMKTSSSANERGCGKSRERARMRVRGGGGEGVGRGEGSVRVPEVLLAAQLGDDDERYKSTSKSSLVSTEASKHSTHGGRDAATTTVIAKKTKRHLSPTAKKTRHPDAVSSHSGGDDAKGKAQRPEIVCPLRCALCPLFY